VLSQGSPISMARGAGGRVPGRWSRPLDGAEQARFRGAGTAQNGCFLNSNTFSEYGYEKTRPEGRVSRCSYSPVALRYRSRTLSGMRPRLATSTPLSLAHPRMRRDSSRAAAVLAGLPADAARWRRTGRAASIRPENILSTVISDSGER